jgi:hypothetical protein
VPVGQEVAVCMGQRPVPPLRWVFAVDQHAIAKLRNERIRGLSFGTEGRGEGAPVPATMENGRRHASDVPFAPVRLLCYPLRADLILHRSRSESIWGQSTPHTPSPSSPVRQTAAR